MHKVKRVDFLLPPKHNAKVLSIPKAPKIPQEPTEEEILEQEKNLEKMWKRVHGHKTSTKPPKKRKKSG